MPPASSYRPLRPAIKAPSQDASEPPRDLTPNSKRKREMIAVACNNCRSRKIACDGKRPWCGHCARRRPTPLPCVYSDKQETNAALRRRVQELQDEVTEHENTMDRLTSLPDDEALRLLHHLKTTRQQQRRHQQPYPPQQEQEQYHIESPPPPPPPPPSFVSPLSDSAGAYLENSNDANDDGDGDDDYDDENESYNANPIPLVNDATLLPPTNTPFDGPWPDGPVHAIAYPPPMSDSGEYLYPYGGGGLSAPGEPPATPPAELETQWWSPYLK